MISLQRLKKALGGAQRPERAGEEASYIVVRGEERRGEERSAHMSVTSADASLTYRYLTTRQPAESSRSGRERAGDRRCMCLSLSPTLSLSLSLSFPFSTCWRSLYRRRLLHCTLHVSSTLTAALTHKPFREVNTWLKTPQQVDYGDDICVRNLALFRASCPFSWFEASPAAVAAAAAAAATAMAAVCCGFQHHCGTTVLIFMSAKRKPKNCLSGSATRKARRVERSHRVAQRAQFIVSLIAFARSLPVYEFSMCFCFVRKGGCND
ncbi:hypothetical protein BKA80DRAFT_47043 [Phyllosticta citrichinensis]